MWPFKKPVPPKPHYNVIDYQVGDSVVCIDDEHHNAAAALIGVTPEALTKHSVAA